MAVAILSLNSGAWQSYGCEFGFWNLEAVSICRGDLFIYLFLDKMRSGLFSK